MRHHPHRSIHAAVVLVILMATVWLGATSARSADISPPSTAANATAISAPAGTKGITITTSAPSVLGEETPTTVAARPADGSAPKVTLSHYEMTTDSIVRLSISGFKTRLVNAALCGNAARRGATDCDVRGSKSIALNPDGTETRADFTVGIPPTSCPCLIRVASGTNDEFAIADITLAGHPIAAVVGTVPFKDRVDARIEATQSDAGFVARLRSSLGGSTEYTITVSIKNRSSEPIALTTVQVAGGKNSSDMKTPVDIALPEPIEPGQTWKQTATAKLSAPVRGKTVWRMDVTAKGEPSLSATTTTSHSPVLLMILLGLLVLDFVVLGVRLILRVTRRSRPSDDRNDPEPQRQDDLLVGAAP